MSSSVVCVAWSIKEYPIIMTNIKSYSFYPQKIVIYIFVSEEEKGVMFVDIFKLQPESDFSV